MTGGAQVLSSDPAPADRRAVRELVDRLAAAGKGGMSEGQLAALTTDDGAPIRAAAFDVRGKGARRALGFAQAVPSPPDGHYSLEVVADPATDDGASVRSELAGLVGDALADRGGGTLRLWALASRPADDGWAVAAGFEPERQLLQMRCRLPLPPDGRPALPTRAYRVGHDEAAWLRANNRAFADHPEQGGWELDVLRQREAEPWFDPEGFRLHEEDGVLAAFCWTKVHASTEPPMGEIYVIGVDPDFQGRGLGRALTRAGLDWLAEHGLEVGMLYVDGANVAAVALYRSLGFEEDHCDRAYVREVGPRRTPP